MVGEMFADTCPLVLLNGNIMPAQQAQVSVFDRGYLFADGVYEGISVYNGRFVDDQAHLDRLERSLDAIALRPWFDIHQLCDWKQQLIEANELSEGFFYLQVSRGIASRDFHYPQSSRAQVLMFAKPMQLVNQDKAQTGVRVCVVEDLRWKRRDIKSIALLPQAIAKQKAVESGCFEAWMQEDGYITEGASTSAFIVCDNRIITRPLGRDILAGVTRAAVLDIARALSLDVQEQKFSAEQAMTAQEAFLTSASNLILPIVEIDGQRPGDGSPGKITNLLRQSYIEQYLLAG